MAQKGKAGMLDNRERSTALNELVLLRCSLIGVMISVVCLCVLAACNPSANDTQTLEKSSNPEIPDAMNVLSDRVPLKVDVAGIQGGYIRGLVSIEEAIIIDQQMLDRTTDGHFFYPIGRDETGTARVTRDSGAESVSVTIQPRNYRTGQVISNLTRGVGDGIEKYDNVEVMGHDDLFMTYEEALAEWSSLPIRGTGAQDIVTQRPRQDRIASERLQKLEALSSRADLTGFSEMWMNPLENAESFRVSSPWGAERIIKNRKQIHKGIDLATRAGTEIVSPASGIVTLANDDFYFEGGVVFIDHGLGLTSMYLHMSDVSVETGQEVSKGDRLGAVGATGRATGPHLCWRLYWRGNDKAIDPTLLIRPYEE